MLEQQLKCGV
jgi:hypothetical protein